MPTYPPQTTGLGTATQITVDETFLALSLSGADTHQINPGIEDAAGTEQATGVALVLTAAAAAGAYTGTITGGASNALAGDTFVVGGFTIAGNNGEFICTASSATTLTLDNPNSAAETHAGTATPQESVDVTYTSYSPGVATVSAAGLITGVSKGEAVIEVSYPVFNNGAGSTGALPNPGQEMAGLPAAKIYKEINVSVGA